MFGREKSAREQAESITNEETNPHFIGVRSKEETQQKIDSFQQNYDQGTVNSLYRDEITKYLLALRLVNALAEKWNIAEIENLAVPILTKSYKKMIRKNQRFRNQSWDEKMDELNFQLNMLPTDRKRSIIEQAQKEIN